MSHGLHESSFYLLVLTFRVYEAVVSHENTADSLDSDGEIHMERAY